jgi:hypothetical protein
VIGSFARIVQSGGQAATVAAPVTGAEDATPLSSVVVYATGGSPAPVLHFRRSATSLQAQRKALDAAR